MDIVGIKPVDQPPTKRPKLASHSCLNQRPECTNDITGYSYAEHRSSYTGGNIDNVVPDSSYLGSPDPSSDTVHGHLSERWLTQTQSQNTWSSAPYTTCCGNQQTSGLDADPRVHDIRPRTSDTLSGNTALYNSRRNSFEEESSEIVRHEVHVEYPNVFPDDQRHSASVQPGDTVCYGMLDELEIDSMQAIHSITSSEALVWDGKRSLKNPDEGQQSVELSERTMRILQTISRETTAIYQFWLKPPTISVQPISNHSKMAVKSAAGASKPTFAVIIYGQLSSAEAVGSWLSDLHMFLQEPENCNKDVPYKNPHTLSFDDELHITTFALANTKLGPNEAAVMSDTTVYTELYSDVTFAEAHQPEAIRTPLHNHQKQALTFMMSRERGWDLEGEGTDIWKKYVSRLGVVRCRNTVTGTTQARAPGSFHGGIIADDMGLGKTCSMLALIAACPLRSSVDYDTAPTALPPDLVKSTLIVVPFPLLYVWQSQIMQHYRRAFMKLLIYHGAGRRADFHGFNEFDIIVTTYHTVALEFKKRRKHQLHWAPSTIFDICWHRVVLDEAHMIRNHSTTISRAVSALQSDRHWCITGTPIQNRLTDVFGLFRFLQLQPWNDYKTFNELILQPWKFRADESALKRLQMLMKSVAIRRPKAVVDLPSSRVLTATVQFAPVEHDVYTKAKLGVLEHLDSAMGISMASGSAYLNALQKINRLRYICNHGAAPESKPESTLDPAHSNSALCVEDKIGHLLYDDHSVCANCGIDLQETIEVEAQLSGIARDSSVCVHCAQEIDTSALSLLPPITSESNTEDTSSVTTPAYRSSKVQTLIDIIQGIPADDKSAVFSYWTTSLNAIERALRDTNVTFCRYDGRMSRARRTSVLDTFAGDSNIKVILVSISCGGQGLDLTAANHAFILEPQWNPMLEEQAMARVHRLGQKKPVTLVRLVVKDTWEEKISNVQERKKFLADLVVDRKAMTAGEESRKQLYYLRELVV